MGYFDTASGSYVTGAETEHEGVGRPAGVSAPQREPLSDRSLQERAKQLIPQRRRDGEPPPAPFDGWGNKSARRDLTRAAEAIAELDGDQAGQFREMLAGEMSELDATAGEAEDDSQEARERVALTLDFADRVDTLTGELVEDHEAFMDWAHAGLGGPEAFDAWLGQHESPQEQQEALQDLAEDYVADLEFRDWIGPELMGQIEALPQAEYEEAMSALAHEFVAEDDEDEFGEDEGMFADDDYDYEGG